MRTLLPAFLLFAAGLRAADAPAIHTTAIPAPTNAAAFGTTTSVSPEGTAWMSWLETTDGKTSLRCATFDLATKKWSEARTLARDVDPTASSAGSPALTVGSDGRASVVWLVDAAPKTAALGRGTHAHPAAGFRALVSQTTNGGRTWSAAVPLSSESDALEFVSLATLADGRVLAAWLDGRAKLKGGGNAQLFSRVVGTQGPDTLIDALVCDCCPTTLTALPDGSAVVGYRGRTTDEQRDIRTARYRHGQWTAPQAVHDDGWKIAGCPVNGPQLASDGGRVAAAWFTAADNDPRVLASLSPDAGARFLMPLRLSETKAAGRVSTLLLHDGAILVTWVDADGGLWLRRVTPDFTTTDPVLLAAPADGRITGLPRLALVRDYAGGRTSAEVLVTFGREREPALQTLLLTVPEGELLEAEKNCDCAAGSDELQGFSIRGKIIAPQTAAGTLRVAHYEVTGIFDEGERDFVVASDVVTPPDVTGREFLGRFERRAGTWVLFSVRIIGAAPIEP